ncbi:uncharacterized protein LOC126674179 isoform X2 [Mercurialis annua]|uniref:uncharacterized protein LOC126674179 isoform X2 n=1 Tax=Mercurialis annua TaxID=3986 RepID=UPI0024AD33FD|nr:uncharacterized protein LOC126674179 isoform X2 [Mercurialis annua]
MAHMLPCYFHISKGPNLEFPNTCSHGRKIGGRKLAPGGSRGCVVQRCTVSSTPTSSVAKEPLLFENNTRSDEDKECLVNEFGWKVRKLARDEHEMREVSQIQAEAFHTPMAIFDDFFFQFFKAEVLAGLLYKLRNSPPDRYACLVAEPAVDSSESESKLVGVVDATAVRDEDVLQYLNGAEEYLYISGIAVSKSFRMKLLQLTGGRR